MFANSQVVRAVNFFEFTARTMLTSTEEMFAGSNIEIAEFPIDDTVVSTKGMFRGCEKLSHIFLNVRPTNSLEDLSEMFADCGGPFRLEFRDEVGDLSHVKTISKLFFNARISEVLNVDSQFFKRKSHRRAIKHDGVFGGDFSASPGIKQELKKIIDAFVKTSSPVVKPSAVTFKPQIIVQSRMSTVQRIRF
jgi:hypothetical protein